MTRSIFYKEWLKIRRVALLCLLVSIGFVVYSQMRIERIIELRKPAYVWEFMLTKDTVLIEILRYLPLAMGVLLALAQFIPEMQQKRLKLTLHLPYNQQKMFFSMIGFGLLILIAVFCINFMLLSIYLQKIFASEFIIRILLTSLVWYIAGIAGYVLTAWICLEPTWKRRIANTLFAVALIRLFFINNYPEAYNNMLCYLIVLSIILTSFAYGSIVRFKEGKQD